MVNNEMHELLCLVIYHFEISSARFINSSFFGRFDSVLKRKRNAHFFFTSTLHENRVFFFYPIASKALYREFQGIQLHTVFKTIVRH